MAKNHAPIDRGLLERYNRPGPRYTSYPTAPHFREHFDDADLRAAIRASNGDPIPRRLSVYVHVPFCTSPCFYCGCNRVVTRDKARGDAYLAHLHREISLVSTLFDVDRELIQLHFGGGTPNFLSPAQLGECVDAIRHAFRFSDSAERDISIELDPRFVTAYDIRELASIGFNRASLGVQDFDRDVQVAVNRVQSIDETRAVVDACRAHGFRSVNIDLIYGLPKQTLDGFSQTLEDTLAIRPDRLAVYSYAHLPELFRAQKQIEAKDLPTPEAKLSLMHMAISRLTDAGYVYIGMDHFALPGDGLATARARGELHRNFMGYTTHADTELLGLGVSAISHVGNTFSQNARDLRTWEAALDEGRLPAFRGLRMTEDDELRAELIQTLMCQGEIPVADLERRYGIEFDQYFDSALRALEPFQADGLVRREPGYIRATSQGNVLLRNIAMCFDAYLERPVEVTAPRFSRTI